MKDKNTAGILAFLLGGLGVHKFYLDRAGQGVLYLLFCWTFIPAVIAFIEAIILLTMSKEAFDAKYNLGLAVAAAAPQNIVVNVANTAQTGPTLGVADRLKQLHDLKVAGALSEDEFTAEKQRLLGSGHSLPSLQG